MGQKLDVAIIGAGPYGLSLAAHLEAGGIDHCVFGVPMTFWRDNMPPGMLLKSDGHSSDLPGPVGGFTIRQFYAESGAAFSPVTPIPAETFLAYGMRFQKRMVPHLDQRMVGRVSAAADGYSLTLADGERVTAKTVVVAAGIRDFAFMPEPFAALPPGLVSHSVVYGAVDRLAGQRVAVIGSGASAIDIASALHEGGAKPSIITRRAKIAFHEPPIKRPLRQRVRRPDTGIGGGWNLWFYVNFPRLFHRLPGTLRLRIVEQTLGPAPGWFMKRRIEDQVPILSGTTTNRVSVTPKGIALDLRDGNGMPRRVEVDHVVAATGFRPDTQRIGCLDPALIAAIATTGTAPTLSRQFETSVPGLYMIGPVAAASFGPIMRFVFGAGVTTAPLARHLARRLGQRSRTLTPPGIASESAGALLTEPAE